MEGAMDDGMAMNMGDASATRADDIAGAALASGDFALLDTRPQGFDDTAGTAWIARHAGGTTVTVELQGLTPDTEFISHVHADACANNGGDHYQFEIGGPETPPNEIHLAFTSDSDGNGFMTADNEQIAGPEAVALVVHPMDLIDNKIACVDFVES
jgi:Cu/Zn superoxide dismutase